MSRLPEHASQQIAATKTVQKKGTNRVFVRFGKPNTKATKLYQKLTGKPLQGEEAESTLRSPRRSFRRPRGSPRVEPARESCLF